MGNRRAEYLGQFCPECKRNVTSCKHMVAGYDLAKLPCSCKPKKPRQMAGVPVTSVIRLSPPRSQPDTYQCPQCSVVWDVLFNRDVDNVRWVN